MTYELHRELFRITAWRDGAVFRTERAGVGWFDEQVVRDNHPAESGVIYTCVSNDTTTGIRRKPRTPEVPHA